MNKHNHTSVIQIPTSILQTWHIRHMRGDTYRIHEHTKLSRPTINKAINHGLATYETILKVCNYYSNKKDNMAQDIETEALKILNNET